MILPNHPRWRFALKVLLTVTAPLWGIPAAIICLFVLMGIDVYEDISRVVDGRPKGGCRGGGR